MSTQLPYTILKTKDPGQISSCARMMAATDPWIRYGMDYSLCLKSFEGDFREIYVLETGQKIAGFVILQMAGTFRGYIQTLCVDADYRGQGLGMKLLEFCEERILKISPNLFICVSEFNTGAIKLYESFGFELVGRLHDFIQPGLTELMMRKTFAPIVGYAIQEEHLFKP